MRHLVAIFFFSYVPSLKAMPGYSAVLWTAWLRSSGSQRCGPLDRKASKHAKLDAKTMKNVKHQNFENLKTYRSYNNLFKLIEVMEHSCFQGKHNFHNFDKFTYMCYNCYNYHNLLITSASTNCQQSRFMLGDLRNSMQFHVGFRGCNFGLSKCGKIVL